MAVVMQEKASFPSEEGRTIKKCKQETLCKLVWEIDEWFDSFSYNVLKLSSLDTVPNFRTSLYEF